MIDTSALPCQLDGYELRELLFDSGYVKTFLAFQTSIKREVLLTLVNVHNEMPEVVDSFIESAKSKAQQQSALICAVYEATRVGNSAYYVQELPPGESLDRILLRGYAFSALELARILRDLASAQTFYEENNLNVSSWTPECVFITPKGDARFLNQVEPGFRPEGVTQRDEALAGHYFSFLVTAGQPGATRVATLCSWLRGAEDAPRGMNWAMARDLAETIIQQLGAGDVSSTSSCPSSRPASNKSLVGFALAGVAVLLIGGACLYAWQSGGRVEVEDVPKKALYPLSDKSQEIVILRNAADQREKKLSVDVHEVTIESYARFLKFMSKLTEKEAALYRMPDQPVRKTSHAPEGWEDMLVAAENNGQWKGRGISLETPMTGVDYWDALVYCKWADRRLPTSEEWKALSAGKDKPLPDATGFVTEYKMDVTSDGLGGLAGGSAEWTSSMGINPAFPMAGEKIIICGGSLENKGNVDTEDYADSPETARPDLGFRTVKDI